MTAALDPVATPPVDAIGSSGPIAVLTEGLGQAARASTLLRDASVYVGVLFVAMAGGGVLAELGILSWAVTYEPSSVFARVTAIEAVERANLLLVAGALGCLVVAIDATAIGMTLLAGRVVGARVTLVDALARARQVFWRLIGASILLAIVQLVVSALYRLAIGARPASGPAGIQTFTVDPVPAVIVSIPFILTTGSIVISDDGVVAALRRSARLIARARRLGVALALFALLSGFVEGMALASGFDILLRITSTLHLDVAAGTPSYVASALLGLAILMAIGSLVFTIAAVIAAPQVIALVRLGVPLTGLKRIVDVPVVNVPVVNVPVVNVPVVDVASIEAPDPADPRNPADPSDPTDQADPTDPADPPVPGDGPASAAQADPAAPQPEGPAEPLRAPRGRVRWITIPMRLVALTLWVIAVSSVLVGPPP
ncbi:MAG: hypothetical protein L0227_10775 [Chloroflexi bacterium]|nr:hypothetical protein [Chloroflexota bacterium]